MAGDVLQSLEVGMAIVWGGTRVTYVSDELASAFNPGDSLIVRQDNGELIHIPASASYLAADAVAQARSAFDVIGSVSDDQITDFYVRFAAALGDDEYFAAIARANESDIEIARSAGRSVTRLILDNAMRTGMIDGLHGWAAAPSGRRRVIETVEHGDWRVEQVVDGLGVIGFVFEGRPNVFADATGVLRGGNTVVFRIGSAALGTAEAIVENALAPALASAGLPSGAVTLVRSRAREAGLAMMNDPRLSLAVARGSGLATQRLGAVARQAGNAVSLHGTGGAWIIAGDAAEDSDLEAAVFHSLDRKVCNTVNTVCIQRTMASELVPAFLRALNRAGQRRGSDPKLHVLDSCVGAIPPSWFNRQVSISRADGQVTEPQAEVISLERLGEEWEWEESPEVTLALVDDVSEAVSWFNTYSPRFAASLISRDADEHESFFAAIDAPFVGNGFTRWVDGQYALDRPELGLSNWQGGRLFGRGGILSGDGAFTVRTRAIQQNLDLGR